MKIQLTVLPRTALQVFADSHALTLTIDERPGCAPHDPERYTAAFRSVEVVEGSMLGGVMGSGTTPAAAVRAFAAKIAGKPLAIRAGTVDRVNVTAPMFEVEAQELVML